MKHKKIIAAVLSICVVAGLMSGCTKKNTPDGVTDTDQSTGRYVEENVTLPTQDNETAEALLKNASQELVVYTRIGDAENYAAYTSSDGTNWNRQEVTWLPDMTDSKVLNFAEGADGKSYVLLADAQDTMHVYQQEDGSAKEIAIPELNEATDSDVDSMFFSFGTHLQVMEDGNLVLEGNQEVRIYKPDGTLLHKFPYQKTSTDSRNPIAVSGNRIAMTSEDSTGFTVYDASTEKEEANMTYGSDVREKGAVVLEESKEIYYANADGIHHMQPDGTLVETLTDGTNFTMGQPSAFIQEMVKGNADDFYILYFQSSGQSSVKHYYYDKDARATASQQLTVYSLTENDTIRQAISVFNQKHPEIQVNYKTGDSDAATTDEDKIRVLNTELLNKSGADVLVLDNLPVDSLIDKGVLMDMSDIFKPLIEDGTLRENIASCYQKKDGTIYQMPVKYGMPLLLGTDEMMGTIDSLDVLSGWLAEHPDSSPFENATYEQLTKALVNLFYDELLDEDGKIKQDKLEQCLTCAKEMGDRTQAEMESKFVDDTTGEELNMEVSGWSVGNEMEVSDKTQLCVEEVGSLVDMMAPATVMRDNGYPIRFVDNTFIPYGRVGINSATKQEELAKEFVQILFSDEVQSVDLKDGFPMNLHANEVLREQTYDTIEEAAGEGALVGVSGAEDGEMMSFTMPLKSEFDALMEKCSELMQPAKADKLLRNIIVDQAILYYEGNQNIEDTVQGICNKVDTYYAE